jgi:hypothetical protein
MEDFFVKFVCIEKSLPQEGSVHASWRNGIFATEKQEI